MHKLLPRTWPFWAIGLHWTGPVFRIIWIGWWQVTYDLTGMFYTRCPHITVLWNDD